MFHVLYVFVFSFIFFLHANENRFRFNNKCDTFFQRTILFGLCPQVDCNLAKIVTSFLRYEFIAFLHQSDFGIAQFILYFIQFIFFKGCLCKIKLNYCNVFIVGILGV